MDERVKSFVRLDYFEPKELLVRLDDVDRELSQSSLPRKVRTLRTNELKPLRELRQGALFAYGIGLRLGKTVLIGKPDRQDVDYDCVTQRELPDKRISFGPVQIKEVVPDYLNPEASLQGILDKLAELSVPDLNVVIHLNRKVEFDHTELRIGGLKISTLWLVAAVTPDRRRWALWGDFLGDYKVSEFDYPGTALTAEVSRRS